MTPDRSQYARLPTTEATVSEDQPGATEAISYGPAATTGPSRSGHQSQSAHPIAAEVDALFRRWTSTIAQRLKAKKRKGRRRPKKGSLILQRDRSLPVEIIASVFSEAAEIVAEFQREGKKGKGKEKQYDEHSLVTLDHNAPMTRPEFDDLVTQVRDAIEAGVHPRLNSKGSSGSYFARNADGHTLGIFKPKDEEPYGQLNPKLTKYIHRVFLSRIIPFGRACLIPQLSYLSESAASLLDRQLRLHIVPRTEVVPLASTAFYYPWRDRDRHRSGRHPLPDKDGSFQVFLKGFQDASTFLRAHPYPGRPLEQTLDDTPRRSGRGRHGASIFGPLKCLCGTSEAVADDDSDEENSEEAASERPFRWTQELMDSFRLELEKLVILDYLIRNTDRGLDNFMMKACTCPSPPASGAATPIPRTAPTTQPPQPRPPMSELNARPPPDSSRRDLSQHAPPTPHIHVAAIDNSLAFPHAHPSGWRTFTYGWLYLPISLIGQPFSTHTRDHFLPLLTSSEWWEETTLALRTEFSKDSDYKEAMFEKQLAVIKGQAWNAVQSLLDPEEGPVELCRRPKKLVWDDFIEVADDDTTRELLAASHPSLRSAGQNGTSNKGVALSAIASRESDYAEQGARDDSAEPPSASSSAPTASMPMSASHARPAHAHRRTTSSTSVYGHRKHNSVSVSSVLGAASSAGVGIGPGNGASFESATGVDMVKHLDWVEREEKRGRNVLGRNQSWQEAGVEEEDENENEQEQDEDELDDDYEHDLSMSVNGSASEEPWGVRSESDALLSQGRHRYSPLFGPVDQQNAHTTATASTTTAAQSQLQRSPTRQRSGSLTNIDDSGPASRRHPPPPPPSSQNFGRASLDQGRISLLPKPTHRPTHRARLSYSAAPTAGSASSRYSADETAGRRRSESHTSWLDAIVLEREGDDAANGTAVTESHRKVVIVERLEALKDEPRKLVPSWCA